MKRIISFLLVLAMIFSLAACGGGGNNQAVTEGSGYVAGEKKGGDYSSEIITEAEKEQVNNQVDASGKKVANPTVLDVFYRNPLGADIISDNSEILEVDKKADSMLKKIENYPDSISVTGKIYYISADGDDNNDGLSPKKPKKTYYSINGSLQSGDAVLFRRGDVFRGVFYVISGVTYGAYGSGIKPRLYGSVDATEGEWEETSTKGVYTYNKTVKYSNIIFDNGKAVGRPVQSLAQVTKRPLNVYYSGSRVSVYCPEGNPKDVYKSIEIVDNYTLLQGQGKAENVKIQNLCLMYAGVHLLNGVTKNIEVEGCIFGYCGGKDLYSGKGASLGNCIEFWATANNVNIHDNYFFQAYDTAITHQGPTKAVNFVGTDYTNIHYENNLIEYCTWDFEAFSLANAEESATKPDAFWGYNDVFIIGNICRYTGWGWGSLDRPDKNVYSNFKYDAQGYADQTLHVKPLYIENNIFDRPRSRGIEIKTPEYNKANMILKNNQFIFKAHVDIFRNGFEIYTGKDDYESAFKKYFGTFEGNTFTTIKK